MFRKNRRINYTKKAKQQRRNLLVALILIFSVCMYSSLALADNGIHEAVVTVDAKDTLWSICSAYKPDGTDIRTFISYVKYKNHLQSAELEIGQEIKIPLD